MDKLPENLIFSFFVSLTMVVIDAMYHLATETAVHINYVAVKFTVIFLTVFLVAHWVGKSTGDGIFTSISGPVIFYIYYIFANPTLNREIFRIDENFGYIFVHIFALLIAYFTVYRIWVLKKVSKFVKSLAYAFIISLCIYGLDAGYQLSYTQFITHNEEMTARVLSFITSIYLAGALFLLSFLSHFFIKEQKVKLSVLVIISAVIIYFIGQNITRSLVGIIAAFVPVYLSNIFLTRK